MRRCGPHYIAFCIGFVSLGMEIIWMHIVAFVGHGAPQSFSFVLSAFLIGIAIGASFSKGLQRRADDLWLLLSKLLNVAVAVNLGGICFFVFMTTVSRAFGSELGDGLIPAGLLIISSAATMAILFPIVHHLAAADQKKSIGWSISLVYGANILGSALGPVCVGLFLIDAIGTQRTILVLQFILPMSSLVCLAFSKSKLSERRKLALTSLLPCLALLAFFLIPAQTIYSLAASQVKEKNPNEIIETGRGVVSVYKTEDGKAIIYGGNVYDGTTNLDPLTNANGIDRIVILAALHPHPAHILVIGLSSGSWVTLLTTFPDLQSMDVVEINDGYLKLIQDYPAQQKAIHDPRVHVHIADGRKWLREYGQIYDLIVMNTTYNWRSYSTNLLSAEMMQLMNRHLASKGLITFNTTGSADTVATAASVFPYTRLRKNFVIAGNFDFLKNYAVDQAAKKLLSLTLDGQMLYQASAETAEQHASEPFLTLNEVEAKFPRKPEIITQDNMITEFKYGRPLF
jgi:predicted membrane-bound spermidine synthase